MVFIMMMIMMRLSSMDSFPPSGLFEHRLCLTSVEAMFMIVATVMVHMAFMFVFWSAHSVLATKLAGYREGSEGRYD